MEQLNFDAFQFSPGIMAKILTAGYHTPTPIQIEAIPLILKGKDVIGLAQAGTGKTTAFVLGILQRLGSGQRAGTRALIISPTSELAEHIGGIITRLGSNTGLQHAAIYGESDSSYQTKELQRKPDIVIGCPNRLLDCVWKGKLNLSDLEILVIDEADKMFGLGALPDIFNILACITNKRQTLLFSATMPDNLRRLSRQFLSEPLTVKGDKPSAMKIIKQPAILVQPQTKTALLKDIIRKNKNDSILVFTRTRQSASNVVKQLLKTGCMVALLQGKFPEHQKLTVIEGLSAGMVIIIVVSGTEYQGIDVSSIFRIINDEITKNPVDETHHVGHTGKLDKNGDAFTLVTSVNDDKLRALEQLLDAPLERFTL